MKNKLRSLVALTAALTFLPCSLMAAPIYGTGNVSPDVIFGSGNANGSFTGQVANNIELGLRGKLRHNSNGNPENTFNYDGDRTYIFNPSDGVAPANRSIFNFEWSVNVDPNGVGGRSVSDFSYLLQIDFDPTTGTDFSFASGDPINVLFADHSVGNNSTGNGQGTENFFFYSRLIAANNVVQQSWNFKTFADLNQIPPGFDVQTQGLYTINLFAFEKNTTNLLAATSIDIQYGAVPNAVPTPAPLALMLGGLALLGFVARRKNK